jgi:hypothetical protein
MCSGVLANPGTDIKLQKGNTTPDQVANVGKRESIEADSWEEIWNVVNERVGTSKKGILFLVDIDNVLTFTNHPCTYPDNVKAHYAFFDGKSSESIGAAWGKVFMNNPQKVIDDCAELVINIWQKNEGKVIGFTSLVVGEDHEIIKKRNGDLQTIFGVHPLLEQPMEASDGAVFYPSCISTNGEKLGKGEVLCEFLLKLKAKNRPKVIIFIDDKEKNLESVRKQTPTGYDLITVHYTGYKTQIPQSPVTMNQFKKFWKQYF